MWKLKKKYSEEQAQTPILQKYHVDQIKKAIQKQPENTDIIYLLVSYNNGEKLFPIELRLLPNETITESHYRVDSFFKNSPILECRKCSILYMSYSKISKSASVTTKEEILNYYHDAKGFVKLIIYPTLNLENKEEICQLIDLMTLFNFGHKMQEIILELTNF